MRLQGCGVCASNLEPWQGKPWFRYPFAPGDPGHEGWGTIDTLGRGVQGLAEGQRVDRAVFDGRELSRPDSNLAKKSGAA